MNKKQVNKAINQAIRALCLYETTKHEHDRINSARTFTLSRLQDFHALLNYKQGMYADELDRLNTEKAY